MEVDILTQLNAISIIKENNNNVNYFIFDEFEIHLNKIPPNSKQEWHSHKVIEEVLVVTEGQIDIRWKENERIINETLLKGSLARVKKSIHVVENSTNNWVEFIVFRMIPSGKVTNEIIKKDKIVIEPYF